MDFGIFDANNHYYEPRDAFTRHLDPRWRERTVHVETDASGKDTIYVAGHMAMGTEIYVADYVGTELGTRLDCLVTPTIPVTCSKLFDVFPGDLYAHPPVLKAYVADICDRMVAWGVKRIFFLNVHGPNLGLLDELSREYMDRKIRCAQVDFWRMMIKLVPDLLDGPVPHAYGHASELAVAVALAIKPDLVFKDRFKTLIPETPLADRYSDVMMYVPYNEVTPYIQTVQIFTFII